MELVFYKIEAFLTSKKITIINHLIIPLFEIHVNIKNEEDSFIFSKGIILKIEVLATSKIIAQIYHNSDM